MRTATHAIAVPAEPMAFEQHGAEELHLHLKLISGEAVPVTPEAEVSGRIPLANNRVQFIHIVFGALEYGGVLTGREHLVFSFRCPHVWCRADWAQPARYRWCVSARV